jgi:hypothetical protein
MLFAVVVAGAACSDAGGQLKGGTLTDGGVAATTPPSFTEGPCIGTGSHWSDLYRDIFGPTGRAGSCSFRSNCHGSADAAGSTSGSGIQCFDEKGCRQSFLDKGLVSTFDAEAPENSALILSILRRRKADGTVSGFMPESPSDYLFSAVCLDRMKAWIRDGAKDD